jgi:hypothetical protein
VLTRKRGSGRPTETLSGLGLATTLYGFLTQATVPTVAAAIAAAAAGFLPLVVSNAVDALYGGRR